MDRYRDFDGYGVLGACYYCGDISDSVDHVSFAAIII